METLDRQAAAWDEGDGVLHAVLGAVSLAARGRRAAEALPGPTELPPGDLPPGDLPPGDLPLLHLLLGVIAVQERVLAGAEALSAAAPAAPPPGRLPRDLLR